MSGSESMYSCKGCNKPLYFTDRRRVEKGVPIIDAYRAVGRRDGETAKHYGLVYFHATRQETEACLFMQMLVQGAKP